MESKVGNTRITQVSENLVGSSQVRVVHGYFIIDLNTNKQKNLPVRIEERSHFISDGKDGQPVNENFVSKKKLRKNNNRNSEEITVSRQCIKAQKHGPIQCLNHQSCSNKHHIAQDM